MRRKIITMALFVSMTLLAASCQKEENSCSEMSAIELSNAKTISYSIDGKMYSVTVQNEAEYDELLTTLLTVAKNGSVVKLYNTNNYNNGAKETITYQTHNLNQAKAWVKDMQDAGYNVTMVYDKDQDLFICTATND
ncbi:MAG: hypothetical protein J5711_07905 [Bacteroidales bacterium]|nr:hypothetical protein [Bacteroidales bacterium]